MKPGPRRDIGRLARLPHRNARRADILARAKLIKALAPLLNEQTVAARFYAFSKGTFLAGRSAIMIIVAGILRDRPRCLMNVALRSPHDFPKLVAKRRPLDGAG